MDGNASDENEDFLITSMQTEVPGSLKQIRKIYVEIDTTEKMIK